MFPSGSALSESNRSRIGDSLNGVLADGIDLYGQLKLAHWNVRGPLFASLHELFEKLADSVSAQNDTVAERAVALGVPAIGTVRQVASMTRLADPPQGTSRDLDFVKQSAEAFEKALDGMRRSRTLADELDDADTSDLLTAAITEYEKNAWFLRATLG
jgi:starvation-inducible DNA-binding protein